LGSVISYFTKFRLLNSSNETVTAIKPELQINTDIAPPPYYGFHFCKKLSILTKYWKLVMAGN
jgi:hypothetical protein